MKKFIKRILLGALVILLMAVSFIAMKCITLTGKLFPGYYLAYRVNDDGETCTITEMVFTVVKKIDIPETIDGYRVTGIGRAFANPSAGCGILTSITIPDGVTFIAEEAFDYCGKVIQEENGVSYVDKWVVGCSSKITSVVLRENTIGIAFEAFRDCRVKEITIPISLKILNDDPYRSLIYYEGTVRDTSNIDIHTFVSTGYDFRDWYYFSETRPTSTDYTYWYYAEETKTVWNVIDYSKKKDGTCDVSTARVGGDFVIPYLYSISPVTSIDSGAFYECRTLTSISIPNSVTTIGSSAFYGCDSLETITFRGTVAQWKTIDFGDSWNYNVPATEVICSDGIVYLD